VVAVLVRTASFRRSLCGAQLCADWRKYQSAGEGAVCLLLGADKKQSTILSKYCEGLLRAPLLEREVKRQTRDLIEFKNGASLEVSTNDARLVRGRSAIAVLGSECCHWKTDEFSASSDEEVVSAAEPSMAMCPDGGILMLGSSVHRKRGFMHRKYTELFGNRQPDTICWFAPSKVMNSRIKQKVIDHALAENPAKARAEYLNVWREDLSDFIPHDVIHACTAWGVHERAPERGSRYYAYVDAASGTGADSFTLAIAHRERDGKVVIDVIRERKPRFIPAQVIAELADLVRSYGIHQVMGDAYASGFHSSEWLQNGFRYIECENSTSENYLGALPHLLAGRVALLDNQTLRTQLGSLERTVGAGDKETVSHPKHANAHDDVVAAICGVIVAAAGKSSWMTAENLQAAMQSIAGQVPDRTFLGEAEESRAAKIARNRAALMRSGRSPTNTRRALRRRVGMHQ
jgi:hypothetical protein